MSDQPMPSPGTPVPPFQYVGAGGLIQPLKLSDLSPPLESGECPGHDGPCPAPKTSGQPSPGRPVAEPQYVSRSAEASVLVWAADRLREERSDYGTERFDGMVTAAERLDQWATDLTGIKPVVYEPIEFMRTLGKGTRVTKAPQHTRIPVSALADRRGVAFDIIDGDHIHILDQVVYQITGYDPVECKLTAVLVVDHRPGADRSFAPPAEQTAAEDLTP